MAGTIRINFVLFYLRSPLGVLGSVMFASLVSAPSARSDHFGPWTEEQQVGALRTSRPTRTPRTAAIARLSRVFEHMEI